MMRAKDLEVATSDAGKAKYPLFSKYPDLLTIRHVRELTGLCEQTIRNEINDGNLPGCRIGRRLYVPKSHFIDYIENGGGLK